MRLSQKETDALYRLFLGRPNQEGFEIDAGSIDDALSHFASSREFGRSVALPLAAGTMTADLCERLEETTVDVLASLFPEEAKQILAVRFRVQLLQIIVRSRHRQPEECETTSGVAIAELLSRPEIEACVVLDERIERAAHVSDVVDLYRLLLGRRPESAAALRGKVGLPFGAVVEGIVRSDEFRNSVMKPVLSGLACHIDAPLEASAGSYLAALLQPGPNGVITGRTVVLLLATRVERSLASEEFSAFKEALGLRPTLPTFRYRRAGLTYRADLTERALTLACDSARATGLFDSRFYGSRDPRIASEGDDALLRHYLVYGHEWFAQPSAEFDEAERSIGEPKRKPGLLSINDRSPALPAQVGSPGLVELELKYGLAFDARYLLATCKGEGGSLAKEALAYLASHPTIFTPGSAEVSIIIPVHGQLDYALSCLDALAAQQATLSAEIIIIDDASPPAEQVHLLQEIPWITYIHSGNNMGFLQACNHAARRACGNVIVLLNSDTRVCRSWLEELVGTLRRDPTIGLVGSKLYNADGSLQEAGALIFRDASGYNYGRDRLDAESPTFSFTRDVDYCSGAAIALRIADWQAVGGFDTRFTPAYYEDVDLAFQIGQRGLRVVVQPLAKVIHYEGKSHGTDETSGVKAFIRINRHKLFAKWRGKLASHGAPGDTGLHNVDRAAKKYALVIDAEIPRPDRDAGSVLARAIIDQLQALDYRVCFLPSHNVVYDAAYSDSLARGGIETFYGVGSDLASLKHHLGSRPIELIMGFRWNVVGDLFHDLRRAYPSARLIFHTVDLHFMRLEREADLLGSISIRSAAEDAHDGEIKLLLEADCTIVTSAIEQELLLAEAPDAPITCYPFTIPVRRTPAARGVRKNLLFVGGFRHTPNVDACRYLIDAIWPSLKTALGDDYCLCIAGESPPLDVQRSACESIKVLGHVEDLGDVIDRSFVLIAPLRFGAGIKGKVLTAMASGLPVVTSPLAIEGTGMIDGKDVLIATTPPSYVRQVCRLIEEDGLWSSVRENAWDFIRERYSFETGLSHLRGAIALADQTWTARRKAARRDYIARRRAREGGREARDVGTKKQQADLGQNAR